MLKKQVCRFSLILLFIIPAAPMALASASASVSGGVVTTPQDVTGGDPEPPPSVFAQIVRTILSIG